MSEGKFNRMKKAELKNETPADAKPVLAAVVPTLRDKLEDRWNELYAKRVETDKSGLREVAMSYLDRMTEIRWVIDNCC